MKHDARSLEIAIVGRACRFPGANSPAELWEVLRDRRCTVTEVPAERWSLERFGHPRAGEPGRSYSWAAGVLDDIWGFDPAAFGITPREAEQMDPQQRLLLELTWEALEDAGIAPSSLAGSETGVFVGASSIDHGTARSFDVASTDAYFATGNAASVLANRISYIFDLSGPSFTVDTACSSSLVALDAAVQALRSGRIGTAIVAGVNILGTPFQFVSFSQASMLSRAGRCQPFSAAADGYARSEGGAVLVLRSAAEFTPGQREYARVVASAVNADGRTNGIALPSRNGQARLLKHVYGRHGLDPNRLAFVEAHGTGTPVGDPIEAAALGEVLGGARRDPLPIGSVKSNIGHTEPAAGLAGVMKALLALEHDLLPATLHCDVLNPNIDFAGLGLAVAQDEIPLVRSSRGRLAGISSYGFGGANAHVVLADAPGPSRPVVSRSASVLMLSAHSRSALTDLAKAYAQRLEVQPGSSNALVAAANRRRDRLAERLVVPCGTDRSIADELRAFAAEGMEKSSTVTLGTAVAQRGSVAFVYSGNGSQWVGMGVAAYRANNAFRAAFDAVDALFQRLSGWSLAAAMLGPDLAETLSRTSVAQPLIFAIQAAATRALGSVGLVPQLVLGHSVGEIAAAEAAGIITLEQAVRVIHYRSLHQETLAGQGGMAVLLGSAKLAHELAETIPDLAVAALNSGRATTLSGSLEALDRLAARAKAHGARVQKLDIPYPFHSPLVDAIEDVLLTSLGPITAQDAEGVIAAIVSTVTGTVEPAATFDEFYWWRNVREPVQFSQAVENAHRAGARVFVEVGPSCILGAHIADTLGSASLPFATVSVLDKRQGDADPFQRAVAVALTRGARVVDEVVLGTDPALVFDLPTYPWQRRRTRAADTVELTGALAARPWHPLIGARVDPDGFEWTAELDTDLLPTLADHVVDGHVLLPGAAFMEMATAVARDWLGSTKIVLTDLKILNPLLLDGSATRQIRCRLQPSTGIVEIASRPRLSTAGWQLHASAKILKSEAWAGEAPPAPRFDGGSDVDPEAVYTSARLAGLDYGPSFRLLDAVVRSGKADIAVRLTDGDADERFGLDPRQVDACLHGLMLLYPELSQSSAPVPYVPVGAAELRLLRPSEPLATAQFHIRRADDRAIVADLWLYGEDSELVAGLVGLRLQAAPALRRTERAITTLVQTAALAAEPVAERLEAGPTVVDLHGAAGRLGLIASDGTAPDAAHSLLEGWASSAAVAMCWRLATDGMVNPDTSLGQADSPAMRAWFRSILNSLQAIGLATSFESGSFVLANAGDLPDANDLLQILANEHPERSAELLLASHGGAMLDELTSAPAQTEPMSASAQDAFDYGGVEAVRAAEQLGGLLDELGTAWPMDRALRILVVGDGPHARLIVDLAQRREADLTLVDPDKRRLERAKLAFGSCPRLTFADRFEGLQAGGYDLGVAVHTLDRAARDATHWTALRALLTPGAPLIAIEPQPSMFRDIVLDRPGARTRENEASAAARTEAGWVETLRACGFDDVAVLPINGAHPGLLCTASSTAGQLRVRSRERALIVGRQSKAEDLGAALATMFSFAGIRNATLIDPSRLEAGELDGVGHVIMLGSPFAMTATCDRIARRCLELRDVAAACAGIATVWVMCPGGVRDGPDADPVEAAVWAFGRTLINEVPNLDLRLADLAPGLTIDAAARRVKHLILSGTAETEIILDLSATKVVHVASVDVEDRATVVGEAAIRLTKAEGSGLDRIRWSEAARRAPERGEVEIAVEASGLNFRDVMWGLSILPEEILEDGYAGPSLGLECAGRVVRIGPEVTGFAEGDRVMAFAKSALASHVTVPTGLVAHIGDSWSAAAAATVPVAFLTAFYGLVDRAQLAQGEWVLIHGGAGGIGLAALQIARWRNANVIATAGTPERRQLLRALGADHVFDSRSMAFGDDIRRVVPDGVHVVLNSLSGEAMEQSLASLRPFGRFVELGKRDYVANTHIGLRPFRRNLSYFGVDLDQLVSKGDATAVDLFEKVKTLFADGTFSPLPYRTFAAGDTVEAFRLMQRSGHVGKIVIRPPVPSLRTENEDEFLTAPDRTHLVIGGLSGFGLETARWLAARGARHLALVGRSAASRPEAAAALAEFARAGVVAEVYSADVADEPSLQAVFDRLAATQPPLAGVIHAATAYADAIAANLTPEKMDAVLRAKVAGADHLDRLTRSMPLDYFILYSSATTLVGNPGQGAYVAANAYLEALARRRRSEGLPGFAVAWGAIDDVGILARSAPAAKALLGRSGVQPMNARDALDRLAVVWPSRHAKGFEAGLAIAAVDWSGARDQLRVLRSPTFARLTAGSTGTTSVAAEKISVRELVERSGPEEAARIVADTVQDEIARILRMPRDDVSRSKPLMEIGLDSLMGVELGMALEQRFTLDAPLSASAGAMTVQEISEHVAGLSSQSKTVLDSASARLADRHLGGDVRRQIEDAYPSMLASSEELAT